VCGGDVVQGVDGLDDGGDRLVIDVAGQVGEQGSGGRVLHEADPAAAVDAGGQQVGDVGGGAEDHGGHPACLGQQPAVGPHVPGHRVEDDVEPAEVAGAGGVVVVHLLGTQIAQPVQVRGAGQRGDPAAEGAGDLDGGGADTAVRAPDQDALPGLQPEVIAQDAERGGAHAGQGGCLHRADRAGAQGRAAGESQDVLSRPDGGPGVTDRVDEAPHLIAGRQPGHVAGGLGDRPGEVEPGAARERPAAHQLQFPGADGDVGRVDAAGGDPDQHVARPDPGDGYRPYVQHLRRAVRVVLRGAHLVHRCAPVPFSGMCLHTFRHRGAPDLGTGKPA
jgi:hypothetical protein